MPVKKKLPIGIENFREIRTEGFYYIDKTGLIRDLLNNWAKVNLFTRPRRFGKSLNMSMLRYFFELGDNEVLFRNLEISNEKELCDEYMGQFPVISISLKGMHAPSFQIAFDMAARTVNAEARRFLYLLDSDRLSDVEKNEFRELLSSDMNESVLYSSLKVLSELLLKHHGRKVIILIDEYDVPLAKAHETDYYEEMVFMIRNFFEQGLKTNDSLQFAVLTGCMRISKESIFTGLNNLRILSIADVRFDEYFGFTDSEVRDMLAYYGLSEHYGTIKEWYDGYRFGNVDVYCPWDVINYCDLLRADANAWPENYWINTSSNESVRRFISQSDNSVVRSEIERLVAGETVEKDIYQELTYRDMYSTVENIWSVLFMTGYLTQKGRKDGSRFALAIPNAEIRSVFATQIMDFFRENVKKDGESVKHLCEAVKNGDAQEFERQFTAYLKKTISLRDTFVRKDRKENFFHGILLGILGMKESWAVFSNSESGDGYGDIRIEIADEEIGVIIELKYADDGDLETACEKALSQIEDMRYDESLKDDGYDNILKYGVACYKKRCKVMLADTDVG